MAVAYVQEWPIVDRSTDNYDFIADKIGTGPFDGLILHSAHSTRQTAFSGSSTSGSAERAGTAVHRSEPAAARRPGSQAFPNPGSFTEPTRDEFYELHNVIQQASVGATR